jgi:hypothetical protein
MSKRVVLAALCCACALATAVPRASASDAVGGACVADASWSISLTSATATYSNLECYSAEAAAGLEQIFPEFSVGGEYTSYPGPFTSITFAYTPIVGLCDGRLSYEDDDVSVTGVLKNDGNFHSVVELVFTSKQPLATPFAATYPYVGALQNACSPTFEAKRVTLWAAAQP